MSETGSVQSSNGGRNGFWRQRFGERISSSQIGFDVMVGIVFPIICFICDPLVFIRGDLSEFGFGSLHRYALFTYLLSALAMLTLTLWLIFRQRVKSWSGSVGGILLAGALCSFLIGVMILPLTIAGLVFMIGFLGFIPFFTSFVYLRNGIRALRRGNLYSSRALLVGSALLSSTFLIAAPFVTQWRINYLVSQSMQEIIAGDSPSTEAAVRRIKQLSWFADVDRIVLAYENETDELRRARLATAYQEITGNDIKDRLAQLRD